MLDVADLESEAEHGYELGPARETENLALSYEDDGHEVADGARVRRRFDRFVMRGRPGSLYRLVARFVANQSGDLEVRVGDETVATLQVASLGWTEAAFDIPDGLAEDTMRIADRRYHWRRLRVRALLAL